MDCVRVYTDDVYGLYMQFVFAAAGACNFGSGYHFSTGQIHFNSIELLEEGDIRTIFPGRQCIHSLFHLDSPLLLGALPAGTPFRSQPALLPPFEGGFLREMGLNQEVRRTMYSYVAYGLGIHSALSLPELVAAPEVGMDVVIRLGRVGRPLPETDPTGSYFHMTAGEAYFFWKQVGAFLVRGGKEIIVEPIPEVEEQEIRLPLLGMVLAAVVQQRGLLALHASAVAMNGDTVAFLGPRGWGKSTAAAALYARGHVLVADDLVVLNVGGTGCPTVLPGFPQLKLFPEAAAASLGDDPEILPRLTPGYEKRARRAADGFSQRPIPLRRMYLLSKGSVPEIAPIQPQEAIATLIGQSYVARVFKQSLPAVAAASNFLQCTSLANRVPLSRLKRPSSLAALADLAQMVEEDLAQAPGEATNNVPLSASWTR